MTVTNSTIFNNSGEAGGGGINNNGTLSLAGSTVSANSSEGNGGGIDVDVYGTLVVTDSAIEDNVADGDGDGGGINSDGVSVTVTDSKIFSNFGGGNGGGIDNDGVSMTVTDSEIASNTVSGYYSNHGGGLANETSMTVTGCAVTQNMAADGGGGIWSGGVSLACTTRSPRTPPDLDLRTTQRLRRRDRRN